MCAGIIAALGNNGLGIAGTAPNAKIMPIKVQNGPFLTAGYAANGITWAADHGAKVASMSFGLAAGTSNIQAFRDAVAYAAERGVVMVGSTGNTPGAAIGFPAAYAEVIGVGSSNCRDQLSVFTTTGPEMDIVAPGEDIFTTVDQSSNPDGYDFENGTSFAAPMVAAVCALVWGVNPNLTADEVRSIVVGSADDLGAGGFDPTYGWGRLNAYAAVREALARLPGCAVDFNGNRIADPGDLFYFLDLYFQLSGQTQGIGAVDFNHDGAVDVGDLFEFMNAWFRGC
jgi:subtilisin family serine protease